MSDSSFFAKYTQAKTSGGGGGVNTNLYNIDGSLTSTSRTLTLTGTSNLIFSLNTTSSFRISDTFSSDIRFLYESSKGLTVSDADSQTNDASSVLTATSTTKGFLPPRLTTTQRNAINTGDFTEGLSVYNTTDKKFQFYNGTSWIDAGGGTSDNIYNTSGTIASTSRTVTLTGTSAISFILSSTSIYKILDSSSNGRFFFKPSEGLTLSDAGNVESNDASSVLTATSTTKGFLPPRLTTTQRDEINGGVISEGLIVYNTTLNLLQFFDSSNWINANATATYSGWFLTGDSGTSTNIPQTTVVSILGTSEQITTVSNNSTITLSLANTGVTANSYTNADITVDATGRITSASNGSSPPTTLYSGNGTIASASRTVTLTGTSAISFILSSTSSYKILDSSSNGRFFFKPSEGLTLSDAGNVESNDASAVLTATSTTKGFLPPRMTTTQRDEINGGVISEGLIVYNTTLNLLQFFDSSNWINANATATYSGWFLTGNSGTSTNIPQTTVVSILGTSEQITTVSNNSTITLSLANTGVTASSYTNANITVDAKGRITSASNGSSPPTTLYSGNGTIASANRTVSLTGTSSLDFVLSSTSSFQISTTDTRFFFKPNEGLTVADTGNVTSNDASAVLTATSTTKGFLPPRMTTTQRNEINGGDFTEGLSVYNSSDKKFQFYNGTSWIDASSLGTVTSIGTTSPITGGTITDTGTIGITQATTMTNGFLSSTDWNTFNNKASYSGWLLTGDSGTSTNIPQTTVVSILGTSEQITTLSSNSTITLSLANTGVTANSYTNANITVDAKGRITSASSGATSPTTLYSGNGTIASASRTVTLTGTSAISFILSSTSSYKILDSSSNGRFFFKPSEGLTVADTGNVTSNDASSVLTATSTTKGFLPPRMTTTQRNEINGGDFTTGLVVYNTSQNDLEVYNGSTWNSLAGQYSGWKIQGSQGTLTNVTQAQTVSILGTTNQITTVSSGLNVTLSLIDSGVSANSYTNANVTVDAKGRITSASNGTAGTITSIGTSSPITGGTITGTGTIGITQATTSANGYLSSTDWNTFNNKASYSGWLLTGDSGTSTNIPQTTVVSILGTSAQITTVSSNSTITLSLANTGVTANSYTNANITVDAKGRITSASNGTAGTITSIGTSSPITGGTITGTGTIGITQATTSANGYLTSTDWNTFNNKTSNVGTVTSIGTTSPITGGTITGTGNIGITQATTSANGYLTSTDWNTFNNKTSNVGTVTSIATTNGITGGTITTTGTIQVDSTVVRTTGNQTINALNILNGTGGNVGIGTTSPSKKLEVIGDVMIRNPSATLLIDDVDEETQAPKIELYQGGTLSSKIQVIKDAHLDFSTNDGSNNILSRLFINGTDGQFRYDSYISSATSTTVSAINVNQNFQASLDTLATLTVDPNGNVVRGSQEATWKFTLAQLNALSNTRVTLLTAPGTGKAIVIEESNWFMVSNPESTTGSFGSNLVCEITGINNFAVATQMVTARMEEISVPAFGGLGIYSRDVPELNRVYRFNEAMTIRAPNGINKFPARCTSISLKVKYRLFNKDTF